MNAVQTHIQAGYAVGGIGTDEADLSGIPSTFTIAMQQLVGG